jgi:hypothetical protein
MAALQPAEALLACADFPALCAAAAWMSRNPWVEPAGDIPCADGGVLHLRVVWSGTRQTLLSTVGTLQARDDGFTLDLRAHPAGATHATGPRGEHRRRAFRPRLPGGQR